MKKKKLDWQKLKDELKADDDRQKRQSVERYIDKEVKYDKKQYADREFVAIGDGWWRMM
jgi:hypothetical protein